MKKIIPVVILLIFIIGSYTQSSAQERINVFKKELMKTRGNDHKVQRNIFNIPDSVQEDLSTSRGAWCTVNFNNHTGYYIHIWIEGKFKGTIAPHAEGFIPIASGWTTIYCESSGGKWFWEETGSCNGNENFDLR